MLGKRGITTSHAQSKLAGAFAPQGRALRFGGARDRIIIIDE